MYKQRLMELIHNLQYSFAGTSAKFVLDKTNWALQPAQSCPAAMTLHVNKCCYTY